MAITSLAGRFSISETLAPLPVPIVTGWWPGPQGRQSACSPNRDISANLTYYPNLSSPSALLQPLQPRRQPSLLPTAFAQPQGGPENNGLYVSRPFFSAPSFPQPFLAIRLVACFLLQSPSNLDPFIKNFIALALQQLRTGLYAY